MTEKQPTSEGPPFVFEGFEPANTTPVPDVLFDVLLSVLSGNQLKVVMYVIRRTLGFKKSSDGISLSQFTDGITTKDGKVLDQGCGIKKRSTVSKILRELIEMGCLESEKGKTDQGDDAVTIYRVRFKGVVPNQPLPSPQSATTVVPNQPLPGSADSATRGSAQMGTHKKQYTRNSNTQETERQGRESVRDDSPAGSGADAPTRTPKKTTNSSSEKNPDHGESDPGPPEMPGPEAPWPNVNTAVLISEVLRGKRYTPLQRTNQENAAKRMLHDFKDMSRQQFEDIFRDWCIWWREHGMGIFTLADLLCRGKNNEIRLQSALDRLEAGKSKQTTTQPNQSQRPMRAGSPNTAGYQPLTDEERTRNIERAKAKVAAKRAAN